MTTLYSLPLSFDDFSALLECHGADLSRWPLETVKPALALIESDMRARNVFAQAERMDDKLRRADTGMDIRIAARHGKTAPALQARIMNEIAGSLQLDTSIVMASQVGRTTGFGLKSLFAPGGTLLMIGLVGFMMGFMQPASAQNTVLDGLVHGQEMVIADDSSTATMGEW